MRLQFKPDFDHQRKLIWSRPDSSIAPFCSVCFKHIADEAVPLKMWDAKGSCAQFCADCVEKYLEVVK
jgi:hypothetical protein